MTEIEARERAAGGEPRAVTLVDCDIHPTLTGPELLKRLPPRWRSHLERFGRRTPMITDLYPRASNAGYRADSWPEGEGGFPGSDLELVRSQLLDEYGTGCRSRRTPPATGRTARRAGRRITSRSTSATRCGCNRSS